MKTCIQTLLVTLGLGIGWAATAQPANDNFGQAIKITGPITVGSNVGATRQPNDPNDVYQPGSGRSPLGGRSVWWRWVAPASGSYTIKTGDRSGVEPNSTFDTQLGVYTGATLATLVEVASCEDDVLYPGGLSSVQIDAIEGQTYHILVDGFAGQTGTIYLYVVPSRFTLSVSVNPPGAGHVSFDPPFDPTGYVAGTVVTLLATPAGGTNFYAWSGDVAGMTNPVTFVMNGNKSITANFFDSPPPLSENVELVWRNLDGRIAGWSFEGTELVNNFLIGSTSDQWRLAAVSDLNNDGSGDLLFQNRDGRITAWFMDGNTRTDHAVIATLSNKLRLVGAGDFNFDTQADLVFQRNDGKLQVRFRDGITLIGAASLGDTAWRAVTVADYNNDGSADIFFQHADGRLAVWLMNGTHLVESILLGKTAKWRLAAVRDMNNDGQPDLLFDREGQSAVWLMDGTTRASAILLRDGVPVAGTWKIVGTR